MTKTINHIRCEVHCQKGKYVGMDLLPNAKKQEKEGIQIQISEKSVDGCLCAEVELHIKNESMKENINLQMERPIKVWLTMEQPEKITAMYLYNEWWTRPTFISSFEDIPDRTQIALFQYHDHYACMIPMVGTYFKTYMTKGTQTELCLEMTAGMGGQSVVEEPLYLLAEGQTIYEAVHKAFAWLAEYKGIRMKKDRRLPPMFRYLGWCSWDAFYRDVHEAGIRQKAEELVEKQVPVKWMVIDDGWFTAREEFLSSFSPDAKKFPEGFQTLTKDLKEKYGVRWVGVWHALGGYWAGIAPESELAIQEKDHLYRTVSGKLIPSPTTGEKFYRNWYEKLNRDGICFVKVDGQSSAAYYLENSLPLAEAVKELNQSMESAASRMDGAVINCMGMAMENVLARPATAISRNSDDFMPDKENGFAEHLLQNAYNAIYHNELYVCDWDMFWTVHEDAKKHSLLRAISGGPIYVSDKPGATNPEILKPLVYLDGEILMMNRAAKPTADCIFSNPLEDGVLKLHNVCSNGQQMAGGIAVYNLTNREQSYSFTPADISDLPVADQYWVYDYFRQTAVILHRDERYENHIQADGYEWFVLLPYVSSTACLGLIDKYVGAYAVETLCETEDTTTAVIHESGTIGWLSEQKPKQVWINGKDVSDKVEKREMLYTIKLPEASSKIVILIVFL